MSEALLHEERKSTAPRATGNGEGDRGARGLRLPGRRGGGRPLRLWPNPWLQGGKKGQGFSRRSNRCIGTGGEISTPRESAGLEPAQNISKDIWKYIP